MRRSNLAAVIPSDSLHPGLTAALLTTQQAVKILAATAIVYLVALAGGRWLKRRCGVRLGLFYQLFCVVLGANVALAVFEPDVRYAAACRAALVLLGTIFALALVDRFVGDLYFERRRQTKLPKLLREVVAILVVLGVLFAVLQLGFDLRIPGLLAGSGIAAIIVGLAMQDLLGNIIAGISIHLEKPFRVGDWLLVDGQHVEVMEINWRATRLRNNDRVFLDLPNSQLVKQTITNFTHSRERHGLRLEVGIDYSAPPNRVKEALFNAARQAPGVLPDPPPKVFLKNFGESSIEYQVRFWIQDHEKQNDIYDAIRTNIWYELHRRQIKIPFPIRTLHVERGRQARDEENRAAALAMLRHQPLFQALDDAQLDRLVARARLYHFGRGERIIEQGAAGESMFVLVSGEANVVVTKNGAPKPVATLRAGDCFGEMSVLTGEPRSAGVVAQADCEVVEITKPVFAELLAQQPDLMQRLSEILAQRRLETEKVLSADASDDTRFIKKRELTESLLARVKSFFEL